MESVLYHQLLYAFVYMSFTPALCSVGFFFFFHISRGQTIWLCVVFHTRIHSIRLLVWLDNNIKSESLSGEYRFNAFVAMKWKR